MKDRYGDAYLEPSERTYVTKSRNAQEAHEAIRPAGTEMHTAEELGLNGRESDLYAMIWKRTIATQMVDARLMFETATIVSGDAEFRATGRHIEFPGYFRAYVEGSDDPEAALDDQEAALPPLTTESRLDCTELEALSHETKPPARFTEATLVRTLEAEGIGRPSTYASIIGTIQDRGYVRKQANQLVPTFTALAVTKLLEKYFPRLVDVGFTAKMEQTLDDISNGEAERLPYLTSFYAGSDGLVEQVKSKEETIDPREACSLKLDNVEPVVRVGRFGPYFEQQTNGKKLTVSIPNDVAPADISAEVVTAADRGKGARCRALGPRSRYRAADLRPCRPVRPLFAIGRSAGGGTEAAPRQHSERDLAGEHHTRSGPETSQPASDAGRSPGERQAGAGRHRPLWPLCRARSEPQGL